MYLKMVCLADICVFMERNVPRGMGILFGKYMYMENWLEKYMNRPNQGSRIQFIMEDLPVQMHSNNLIR